MHRAQAFLVLLVLFTWILSGCSLFEEQEKPKVDLADTFPDDLPAVGQVKRLDVNGESPEEWLVFYHIDLVEGNKEGSPTAAAVYRPVPNTDERVPPQLVPALLWLPSQGYLCLHTCEAKMEDVISKDSQGAELVILDKRGKDTVGAAIFRWKEDLTNGGFVPLGHFRADSIAVKPDEVTVIHKHHDRSDLAAQEIYVPQAGRYYYQELRGVDDSPAQLIPPQQAEIIFAPGPPADPSGVKLPEKLVLALYLNFHDRDEIKSYFTDAAWNEIGQDCPGNKCGCTSKYQDVSRVMVKQIVYEGDLNEQVQVIVHLICVNKNNELQESTLAWRLARQSDETWRLSDVTLGGAEFLCPPSGCPTAKGGQ